MYELTKVSDVVFIIRSDLNTRTLSNVDSERLFTRARVTRRIIDERLTKRLCLTQAPTQGYARDAGMSLKEYEGFVYSAILIDWIRQRAEMGVEERAR